MERKKKTEQNSFSHLYTFVVFIARRIHTITCESDNQSMKRQNEIIIHNIKNNNEKMKFNSEVRIRIIHITSARNFQ